MADARGTPVENHCPTTYDLATIGLHVLQMMTERQTTNRGHIVHKTLKTLDLKWSAKIVDLRIHVGLQIVVNSVKLHFVSKKTGPLLRFEITPTNCA